MMAFGGASEQDTVAEWLRRWTANPMCSARVGSNPIGVVLFSFALSLKGSPPVLTNFEAYLLRDYSMDFCSE